MILQSMQTANDERVLVAVINYGVGPNVRWPAWLGESWRCEPQWLYRGNPYTYKVSKAADKPVFNIVHLDAANFHWAVEIDPFSGELRRCPWVSDDEFIWEVLTDMCCELAGEKFTNESADILADDCWPALADWYQNGVKFKMKRYGGFS